MAGRRPRTPLRDGTAHAFGPARPRTELFTSLHTETFRYSDLLVEPPIPSARFEQTGSDRTNPISSWTTSCDLNCSSRTANSGGSARESPVGATSQVGPKGFVTGESCDVSELVFPSPNDRFNHLDRSADAFAPPEWGGARVTGPPFASRMPSRTMGLGGPLGSVGVYWHGR